MHIGARPGEEHMPETAMPQTATPQTVTTSTAASLRPQTGEYAPHYEKYVSLLQSHDVLATLEDQRLQTLLLLSGRTEADGCLRYAPGKWSLKEVLGRNIDTERVMSYRAV